MTGSEPELPKDQKDKLDSIDETLKEILRWIRFENVRKLKETLVAELETDQKKIAYENTDGVNGMKEVAAVSGVPQDTVYGWWQQWFRLGIVVESETRQGRMEKIVSLEDVGIKLPRKAKAKPASIATASQSETAPVAPPLPAEGST